MTAVYEKTANMLLILFLGYLLKRLRILSSADAKVLSKIVINLILPCVIIKNLNGVQISGEIWASLFMGFFVNFILTILALLAGRGKTLEEKYIYLFSLPLFNISGYALPVIELVATREEVTAVLVFNLCTTIFTYIIVPEIGRRFSLERTHQSFGELVKPVFKNVPAMVSCTMVVLGCMEISLNQRVVNFCTSLSSANTVLAMLSIGLLFDPSISGMKKGMKVAALRLISVSLLAFLMQLMPLGDMRGVIMLVLFAPMVSCAPALALECGYTGSGVATANSAYLPISVILMSILSTIIFH